MTQSGTSLLTELAPLLAAEEPLVALRLLRHGLNRLRGELSPEDWRSLCARHFSSEPFIQHPLSLLLRDGPLGSGGAGVARGFVHQPLVLDVIYGQNAVPRDLSPAAKVLHIRELSLGFCASLRSRHRIFTRELNDIGNTVRCPRVLAVGCGHLREAAQALKLENMACAEFVAYDSDPACIDLTIREYRHPGLFPVGGSLRKLMNDSTLGHFHFICAPTLFDVLDDLRLCEWFTVLLPLLKPGGRLLAANFSYELADAAFLEACLDWWPFYRGEDKLAALLSQLPGANLRGQAIFRDDTGGSLFMDVQAV